MKRYRGYKVRTNAQIIERVLGTDIKQVTYVLDYLGEEYCFSALPELKKWLDMELGYIPVQIQE